LTEGTEGGTLEHRRTERFSHALYGLIILTAALGAERAHITEALEAIALLLSTGMILLLAHIYSAVIAERSVDRHGLGMAGRRMVLADNLPVVAATIVPTALLTFAAMGVISLRAAYDASIAFNLAALFGIGLYEGRAGSMSWFHSTLSGAAAGAIGVVVIVIEAYFD
jgi:hypothetical protein